MAEATIGLIGLGVMGENLALNIERNGFPIAVFNRTVRRVDEFLAGAAKDKRVLGTRTPEEFVAALQRPRKLILLVKAGDAVDETIAQLRPFLEAGDILIDAGNSQFQDTRRREADLKAEGLRFIGSGVSGGEEGALWGPSLMPGGDRAAYEAIRPIWEAIAAKVEDGPCVTYVGPDGAGHFVKMVHNGIEYGDMQLIAESYDILHRGLAMDVPTLASTFAEWNLGELDSFLIEITAHIFTVRDPETGRPLVDLVLDKAGQKGTGKWTSMAAQDLSVPIPTIDAALTARLLSALKSEREAAAARIAAPPAPASVPAGLTVDAVREALYASKICSYAQGMALIRAGSAAYDWNIDLQETARIWKGGCIIRARFLNRIQEAYRRDPDLPNLLLDPDLAARNQQAQAPWRIVVGAAQTLGIPVPAMSASLAYFDAYRTARLPQNLTQAQRDLFGAHTYDRVDRPNGPSVHTDWLAGQK